jgi:hypothetical protein
MIEYIKREDALREICADCNCANECDRQRDKCYDYARISLIPAADVRENVRGEWIHTTDDVYAYYKCSVCGLEIEARGGVPTASFCQNCGADMRGENND